MSSHEEKLISPLAILFSQSSIQPTFQDGHDLNATTEAIDAVPCDILRKGTSGYSVLLQAPFPPIEIVRMTPPDSERERWITFDNRRLCCLQRAAVAQWPNVAAAVVKVRLGPVDAHAARKMGTSGVSVNICRHRGNDLWDWMASRQRERATAEGVKRALLVVRADADAPWWDMSNPPKVMPSARPEKSLPATSVADLFNLAKRWEAQKDADGPPGLQPRRAANPQQPEDSRCGLAVDGNVQSSSQRNAGQEILSLLHGTTSNHTSTDPGQDILAMLQKPPNKEEELAANAGQDILAMLRKPQGAQEMAQEPKRAKPEAPPGIAGPSPATATPPPPPARTLEEELRLREEEQLERFRLQQHQQQQLDIQQFQLQELQRQQQLQQLQQYKDLWHQKLQHAQLMQQFMLQPDLKNLSMQHAAARAPPRTYTDALVDACAPNPCLAGPLHPACQPGLQAQWTPVAANPWAQLGIQGCGDASQWPASAMACSNAVGPPWLQGLGPGAVGADTITRR